MNSVPTSPYELVMGVNRFNTPYDDYYRVVENAALTNIQRGLSDGWLAECV